MAKGRGCVRRGIGVEKRRRRGSGKKRRNNYSPRGTKHDERVKEDTTTN
jgi:hypothetical protein